MTAFMFRHVLLFRASLVLGGVSTQMACGWRKSFTFIERNTHIGGGLYLPLSLCAHVGSCVVGTVLVSCAQILAAVFFKQLVAKTFSHALLGFEQQPAGRLALIDLDSPESSIPSWALGDIEPAKPIP